MPAFDFVHVQVSCARNQKWIALDGGFRPYIDDKNVFSRFLFLPKFFGSDSGHSYLAQCYLPLQEFEGDVRSEQSRQQHERAPSEAI